MEFDAVHVCHTPENRTQIEACNLTISGLVFGSLTNITSCSVFIIMLIFSYLEHNMILHKAKIPQHGLKHAKYLPRYWMFCLIIQVILFQLLQQIMQHKSSYQPIETSCHFNEVSCLALYKLLLALPGVPTYRNGIVLLLNFLTGAVRLEFGLMQADTDMCMCLFAILI